MIPVKITAAAICIHQDLIDRYENLLADACFIEKGMSWTSEEAQCPQGFCQSAWSNLQPYVFALANGCTDFFDGWMKQPGTAMISCNDGFRPVSFLLEAQQPNKNDESVLC